MNSYLHQIRSLLCLIASISMWTGGLSNSSYAEVLELWLNNTMTHCPEPILLTSKGQVTLEFPEDIQVAAPAEQGYLQVHIAPQLVVVQPNPPDRWKPTTKVGLSVILKGGGRLYCEFYAPNSMNTTFTSPSIEEPSQKIKTIRFSRTSVFVHTQRAALEMIRKAHNMDQAQDALLNQDQRLAQQELKEALQAFQQIVYQKLLLQNLAQHPIKLSSQSPLRAQEGLIYLTIHQQFSLGNQLYLRASLLNRSQPLYEVESFKVILPTGTERSIKTEPQKLKIPPNSKAIYFAFQLPLSDLKASPVQPTLLLTSSDGRQLSLSLPIDL